MQSLKDIFYVKDFVDGHPEQEKLVPAKFLIGLDGKPVENPNSTLNTINKLDNHYFNADRTEIRDANPHNYLVVPVNYSIFTATDFAHRINRTGELSFSSIELMVKGFLSGGGEDLQKTYQNADGSMTFNGNFVPMFQDAASFHLGMVAQLTGYGASLAENAGSAVELFSKSPDLWSSIQSSLWSNDTLDKSIDKLIDTFTRDAKNNDRNMHSIAVGAAYIQSHIHEIAHPLPPMEPVDNEQPITDQNMERPFHEGRLQEPAHQAGKLPTEVGALAVDVDNEANNALPDVNPIINNETLADDGTPGYDSDGYDINGYDSDGYDSDGYDINGYDSDGYDSDGYDSDGYDNDGYDSDGYDINGYDSDGYDSDGYDSDGYDSDGYDINGYDSDGYDSDGFDINGYDSDGYDINGDDNTGGNGDVSDN